jgi:hypothetical protein
MPDHHENPLVTPVALTIFNRPQNTAQVFAEIAKAKPKTLFIIADGPRPNHPADEANCARTRAVVEQIDWECTVHRNYSEQNLGCKRRVSSGLDWVFEQVEEAIILEDDILVDPSFFPFMEEMLAHYRHDDRVMQIAGYNAVGVQADIPYSYFFTQWSHIWGWATWRRAWQTFDVDMSLWSPAMRQLLIQQGVLHPHVVHGLEATFQGKIDSWGYGWLFHQLINSGLSVVPQQSLIRNIGFGPDATHTVDTRLQEKELLMGAMSFPLTHPPYVMANPTYDAARYALHNPSIGGRIKVQLSKWGQALSAHYAS